MLDFGWSELILIGVVALLVIGPRELPAALRQLGRWLGAVRRVSADFRAAVDDAMREAELEELRQAAGDMRRLDVESILDPDRAVTRSPERSGAQAAPATPQAPKGDPVSLAKGTGTQAGADGRAAEGVAPGPVRYSLTPTLPEERAGETAAAGEAPAP